LNVVKKGRQKPSFFHGNCLIKGNNRTKTAVFRPQDFALTCVCRILKDRFGHIRAVEVVSLELSMNHLIAPNFALVLVVAAVAALVSTGASAQIYRCNSTEGVEYINNAKDAQVRGCKTMQGGNVTVIAGTSTNPVKSGVQLASASPSSGSPNPSVSPQPRNDGSPAQKSRDSDSRIILESELKKVETKLAEQQKEYNNGEPEKQGIEGRNYQRYLDRVAEMKNGIARYQSDISSLKREISRLPAIN
jgi:hypothetical protein